MQEVVQVKKVGIHSAIVNKGCKTAMFSEEFLDVYNKSYHFAPDAVSKSWKTGEFVSENIIFWSKYLNFLK